MRNQQNQQNQKLNRKIPKSSQKTKLQNSTTKLKLFTKIKIKSPNVYQKF